MAYNELIKNFNRIRDYMREFYIYGFKRRDEYTKKSSRSYDDERRRMESLLGDYMRFRQTADGKNVFISIDSRVSNHNPLYKAWKAKSFTDGDITLHFVLLDILSTEKNGITLSDIVDKLYEMLPETSRQFDESTIRKKYFFSETAPCGVIGSFLLDKVHSHNDRFAFKHHYITGALDSDIACLLFDSMKDKCNITLETINRHRDRIAENHVIPLRIMISVQSGRQYLMAYVPRYRRITSFRLDNILSVKKDEKTEKFDYFREQLDRIQSHMWGVSTQSRAGNRMEHVDFTVTYSDNEKHIPKRLEREKRCGTVEHLDDNTSRFSADVYDATELVPWIRTFICRIKEIHFSNEILQKQFRDDMEAMYRLYGIEEGGESNAVQ